MYSLYLRFVQQVKQEEINTYNNKHRDYLIRAGKIQPQNNQKPVRSTAQRPRKDLPRQSIQENIPAARNINTTTATADERPLKGSDSYNIPQDEPIQTHQKNPQRLTIQNQMSKPKAQMRALAPVIQPTFVEQPNQPIAKLKQQLPIANATKNVNQQPAEFEEVVLVECPQGCGKKFNERALEKHVRICGKAEVKRKVFKTQVVDDEALKAKGVLKTQQKQQNQLEPKKETKQIPKWKLESNSFRNAINQVKAGENGKPAPPLLPEADYRVECSGCGRKFNDEAAKKHIPNCVKRNGKK